MVKVNDVVKKIVQIYDSECDSKYPGGRLNIFCGNSNVTIFHLHMLLDKRNQLIYPYLHTQCSKAVPQWGRGNCVPFPALIISHSKSHMEKMS